LNSGTPKEFWKEAEIKKRVTIFIWEGLAIVQVWTDKRRPVKVI
jgi:hypothetical protein